MSFYDDASIVLIPSGYKTSKLYSQKPTDGSGDLTFTRTGSTATRVNESGLIERCRTNVIKHSEDITQTSVWTNNNGTISSNAILSPTNTLTADLWYPTTSGTAGNTRLLQVDGSFVTGQSVTASIYVKANGFSWVKFFAPDASSANHGCWFNISTGVVGTKGSSVVSASITNVGNGWYRLTTVSVATSNLQYIFITCVDADNSDTVTKSGTNGIYVWGSQVELGDIATDYIQTTSAAVTVGPIANLPRLDYTGGGCPKLLMEPTRTNNILYSEMFSDTSWTKTNAIVSGNVEVSPDGYRNADLLLADTTNALHNVNIANLVSVSGTTYVASVFVKYGGYDYVNIQTSNATTANLTFRFSTEQATLAGTRAVVGSEKVEKFPNGWFRLSYATVSIVTATFLHTINIRNDLNQSTFIGDGTKGVYAYGFQYEIGSYATSYIPTFNASVTRNADSASKTGISSLIGQTEGTLYSEFIINGFDDYGTALSINNGTTQESVWITIFKNGDIRAEVYSVSQGGIQASFTKTGNILNQNYKIAIGYSNNNFAFFINGVQVGTTDTNGSVPISLSRFDLDYTTPSSFVKSSLSINKALIFKTRLSNSDLATLTTL